MSKHNSIETLITVCADCKSISDALKIFNVYLDLIGIKWITYVTESGSFPRISMVFTRENKVVFESDIVVRKNNLPISDKEIVSFLRENVDNTLFSHDRGRDIEKAIQEKIDNSFGESLDEIALETYQEYTRYDSWRNLLGDDFSSFCRMIMILCYIDS